MIVASERQTGEIGRSGERKREGGREIYRVREREEEREEERDMKG